MAGTVRWPAHPDRRRRSATSETLVPDAATAKAAATPLFLCAFSHHAHDTVPRPLWGPPGACDCCADLFADWDIPAPPAVAVACFGPLGPRDVCEACLKEYLPTATVLVAADAPRQLARNC